MMSRRIILILLAVFIGACNSVGTRQKGDGLVTALDEYVAALRWGRFDSAREYHLKKDGTVPDIDTSQAEYIRVTGHTMKKKVISEDMDSAAVQIEMQYYHNEYGTLKKIVFDQGWWYEEASKRWLIHTDFPKF